jgi:hypothetical protein
MTVKELKKALKGVPDHIEVRALKDGVYCEKTDVWMAGFQQDEDENGESTEEFVINC